MNRSAPDNQKGFTLVELMIVVTIVGLLAAIGGVAYVNYVKSAKTTKLRQYALDVSSAQEQYKSRNSQYLDLAGTPYTKGDKKWENLLGFKKQISTDDVTIRTAAGTSADDCPTAVCGTAKSFDSIWYAVSVSEDLDPSSTEQTTIRMDSALPEPIVVNEGE